MQFQKAVRPLRGEISVPGDKSISHRAVMFGAISEGTTEVTNFLQGRLRKQRNNDTLDLRHSCRPELFQYTDR